MVNICPVCGYLMRYPPADYHICPSCGTEFGYDDVGRTYAELREQWIRTGMAWWSPVDLKPEGWNPIVQMVNATLGLTGSLVELNEGALAGPYTSMPVRRSRRKRTKAKRSFSAVLSNSPYGELFQAVA